MGFGRSSDFVACFIFVSFLVGVFFSALSNRWNCPTINHEFAAGDGGGSVRCEKRDEFSNLIGLVWATQGNTAEHARDRLESDSRRCAWKIHKSGEVDASSQVALSGLAQSDAVDCRQENLLKGGRMETIPEPEEPPAATELLAYSIEEAAAMLGVHYFSIYRLIQRGKLKACRALRGKLLVPRTELLKLLKTD